MEGRTLTGSGSGRQKQSSAEPYTVDQLKFRIFPRLRYEVSILLLSSCNEHCSPSQNLCLTGALLDESSVVGEKSNNPAVIPGHSCAIVCLPNFTWHCAGHTRGYSMKSKYQTFFPHLTEANKVIKWPLVLSIKHSCPVEMITSTIGYSSFTRRTMMLVTAVWSVEFSSMAAVDVIH